MIARLLRLAWIVVLIVAGIVAWAFVHWFGARIGPWAAGLLGIAVIASAHPAAIAFNFVASRIAGDPVPAAHRLSLRRAIATYDAEIDASMRGFWFATPFLPHRAAPRPPPGTALRGLPILFIHGAFCNRAVWHSFMRDAAGRGYLCEAVTLPDPMASIETQLPAVSQAIGDLLEAARRAGLAAERVAIVGHSMGGLVARLALAGADASRIGPVVTLGTPHHGTHVARLGAAPSVVQMRRGGAWLAALRAGDSAATRTRMTTLFSYHDDIVYPQTTAMLEGATNLAIGGCGHVALLYDRRVRTLVFDRLAAVAADQAAIGGAADGAAAS